MSTSLIIQNKNLTLEDAKATTNRIPILSIHSPSSKKNGKPEYEHLRSYVNRMVLIEPGGTYVDLGDSVEVIAVCMRFKAAKYSAGKFTTFYHQVNTGGDFEGYARIRTAAQNGENGCKYGPEFLLYLPETGKFATLFCGTIKEKELFGSVIADAIDPENPKLHNVFTLKTKYLDSNMVKYERMVITALRSDLDFSDAQPDLEEFKEVGERFLNVTQWIDDPGDER